MKYPFSRTRESRVAVADPFAARLAEKQSLCASQASASVDSVAPDVQRVTEIQTKISDAEARLQRLQGRRETESNVAQDCSTAFAAVDAERLAKLDQFAQVTADGDSAAESSLSNDLETLRRQAQSHSNDHESAIARVGALDRQLTVEQAAIAQLHEALGSARAAVDAAGRAQAEAVWDAAVNELTVAGAKLKIAYAAVRPGASPRLFGWLVAPMFSVDRSVMGIVSRGAVGCSGMPTLDERTLDRFISAIQSGGSLDETQ